MRPTDGCRRWPREPVGTSAFYIRQALEEHLDELEEAYSAQRVLERVRNGEETTSTLDDIERELGLAD